MSDWRKDPATEAQTKRLNEEGIKYPSFITKGEASDLIGSSIEPDEHETAILKFFRIRDISKMSQTDARTKIEEIFDKAENKDRWDSRPADKNQKEIYRFFNLPIPSNLTLKDAEKYIDELFEDEGKREAWETHEDEIADRESWFEDTHEMMNDVRDIYDCKKIGKQLFREVVDSFESSGMTLEQIEQNEDAFFERALEIKPELRRVMANTPTATTKYESNKKSGIGLSGSIILVVVIIMIIVIISSFN